MFFQLQFSQSKFLEMMRDEVQRALPLIHTGVKLTPQGAVQVVDHLDAIAVTIDSMPAMSVAIAGPVGQVDIPGSVLRIKIDLAAHLVPRAQVIGAGHLGAPKTTVYKIWVKADLSAGINDDALVLSVVPVEIGDDANLIADDNKKHLLANILPIIRNIVLPEVAGSTLKVRNAGLTAHAGVIAIAAEITPVSNTSVQEWTSFYAGNVGALAGDWSIVLPRDLIVSIVDNAITKAVDALPADDPKVAIVSEPSTSWGATGPVSTATINAVDACPVIASDIEVDLSFTITFAIDQDKIKVTIAVEWDLNNWDVAKCGAGLVVLPGSFATVIAGVAFGPAGAVAGGIVSFIGFIFALVHISDKADGKLSQGIAGIDPGDMDLHAVAQDNDHVVIEGKIALGQVMPGMTATSIAATPAGLQLSGTLTVPEHKERSLYTVSESPFRWNAGYSCSEYRWKTDQVDAVIALAEPAAIRRLRRSRF